MQTGITYKEGSATRLTTFTMANIAGQMVTKSVLVNDGRPRTVTFDTDVSGQVIRRRESDNNYSQGDPSAMWYRFAGRQMGMITNNGGWEGSYAASVAQRQAAPATTAPGAFANGATVGKQEEQFSSNLEVINSYSQGSVAGSYVVRSGDSLQGIAQNLWGDSGLWYKLAEANGLSGAASLFEGQTLRLPAGVMRNTYNASSVTPYNPAETLGDVTPSTPQSAPPKKQKCGVFGQILLVIIAVVVTLYLGPEFTQALAKFLPQAAASFAGWGSAAAAASIVSQSVGVATGIQEKFSWKEVGAAFITGGVAGPGQKAKSLMEAVIQGAKNSAISQGINVTLGLQDKFSWAAVAAAGVGSGVGYKVGNMVGARPLMGEGSSRDWGNIGRNLVASGASAIASAAARSLVEGSDFKNNLRAAWPGAIGGTIAAAIAGEMGIDVVVKPKQEDPGDGVGTVEPIKLPPGKPIDFPKASFANLSILSDLNLNPAMKVAELRAKAAKIYGVSVDSSDLIVAEDPLPEAGISAKNSYPLLVYNKVTKLIAGTLNFSNVGDAGPLNIRSFSIRGPGDATAIRIITTQSGALIYDGGDVSFNSIGLQVSYEPIVASATTGDVSTPTVREQQEAFINQRNQSSDEIGKAYFGTIGFMAASEIAAAFAIARAGAWLATARNGVRAGETLAPKGTKLIYDKGTKSWTTPAGLTYEQGSTHVNRIKHLLDHTVANPTKPVHSVFNVGRSDVLGVVDEAWTLRQGPGILQNNGNRLWDVNMGRLVGTNGQTSIRVVVKDGTTRVITAFPR